MIDNQYVVHSITKVDGTFSCTPQKLSKTPLFQRSINIFQQLEMQAFWEQLSLLKLKIESKSIMVIGEFKRGKSTFINALLGEELLPAYAIPTTSVITEIKWSIEKKAMLYFKHPLPKSHINIPTDVKIHIAKARTTPIPPMLIKYQDLEKYVVIPDPIKDPEESVLETPYKHVELFWPLDILQNGVELIDSPGLNEHKTRITVTQDYLRDADALLFVISCLAPFSRTEADFIYQNLISSGYTDIFFICNRIDQVREKERDRLKDYINTILKPLTDLKNGIHFISSALALDGRIEKQQDKVEESGILPLEAALKDFLFHNGFKTKQLRLSRKLLYLLMQGKYNIQLQPKTLDSDKWELEKRLEKLSQMEQEIKQIEAELQVLILEVTNGFPTNQGTTESKNPREQDIKQNATTGTTQIKPTIESIKKLINKNDTKSAIAALIQLFAEDKDKLNQAILLSTRYQNNQKLFHTGTLRQEDYQIEITKINKAVLEFFDL